MLWIWKVSNSVPSLSSGKDHREQRHFQTVTISSIFRLWILKSSGFGDLGQQKHPPQRTFFNKENNRKMPWKVQENVDLMQHHISTHHILCPARRLSAFHVSAVPSRQQTHWWPAMPGCGAVFGWVAGKLHSPGLRINSRDWWTPYESYDVKTQRLIKYNCLSFSLNRSSRTFSRSFR